MRSLLKHLHQATRAGWRALRTTITPPHRITRKRGKRRWNWQAALEPLEPRQVLSTFQVAPSQTQITEGQSMSFTIQRLDGLEFAEDVPYQFVADQADLTHPDDYWQYNMYGSATGAHGVLHFAENAHSGYLSVGLYEDTLAESAANFALILSPAGGSPITTTIVFVDNDIPAPEIEVYDAGNSSLYDGMNSVYLPTLTLGQSTEYTLRVRNAGDADLNLTPSGYNLPSDVTVAPGHATVLAPGAETNLTLIFTPTTTGYYWRDVGLDNNDADENPFNIQFYANVTRPAPEIEVYDATNSYLYDSWSQVYLPTLTLGQSTEYTLRVRNAGDADLNLTPTGYNLPGDVTVAPGHATLLPPGAETNLTLIFTPTTTGYYWRDVGLDNNDADENPFNVQFYSYVAQPTVNVWATAETAAAAEEGPTPRVFTLHRDNAQGDLTVQFIMQGAADPYSDYTLSAAASALPEWTAGSSTDHVNLPTYPAGMAHTVVFRAGETTLPITLTPIDDTVFNEGIEQAELVLQWSSAYTITQGYATIAIEENDLPPEVWVTTTDGHAAETPDDGDPANDDTAAFTIHRNTTQGATTVYYYFESNQPDDALPYTDFHDAPTYGMATIADGQQSVDVIIHPFDDTLPEPTEHVRIRLSDYMGQYTLRADHTATAEIAASDQPPEIAVYDEAFDEILAGVTMVDLGEITQGEEFSYYFLIENQGHADLELDAASLTLPSGYTVEQVFDSPVPGGDYTVLVLAVDTTSLGVYAGTVSFSTNDPDDDEYVFSFDITAEVVEPAPEISIMVDGQSVPHAGGGADPVPVNFGAATVGQPLEKVFTIHNTGAAALTIDTASITLPAGFAKRTDPASTVAPGESTEFTIQLTAETAGEFQGTLSIGNNDSDENPYLITLSGTVAPSQPFTMTAADAYAWEGGDLNFFVGATHAHSDISFYDIDIDNDGAFDLLNLPHDSVIAGALTLDVSMAPFPELADNGEYNGAFRATTVTGESTVFQIRILVGNVDPWIDIVESIGANPGEPLSLAIVTTDPGPDIVTAISIDWGDGVIESFGESNVVGVHVYPVDGVYTVAVSAVDEDGTYQREYELHVGDTNADAEPTAGPAILGGYAFIISEETAEFTIEAQPGVGGPIVSYEWDLDGDGEFESNGGTHAVVQRLEGHVAFQAAVRVTDLAGRTAEAVFSFVADGAVGGTWTENTYRDYFRRETPDMPTDWQVHHTKQQVLTARYFAERGVNVHDRQYLRAVPRHVHHEVTWVQETWWQEKVSTGLYASKADAHRRIPLAEVEAFETSLESVYGQYWMKSGPNQAKRVKEITNTFNTVGKLSKFTMGKANRAQSSGLRAVAAVGALAFVATAIRPAYNIAKEPPENDPVFQHFVRMYEAAIVDASDDGYLTSNAAHHVRDSFVAYLRKIEADERVVAVIDAEMSKYIDRNHPR